METIKLIKYILTNKKGHGFQFIQDMNFPHHLFKSQFLNTTCTYKFTQPVSINPYLQSEYKSFNSPRKEKVYSGSLIIWSPAGHENVAVL